MISKPFVTAFMATCLMAGSNASPCRVSSRSIEATTTTDVSVMVSAETEAPTTTTTEASIVTDGTTATGLTTSDLSSIEELTSTIFESQSTTETSTAEGSSYTELSTTGLSYTEEFTLTVTETTSTWSVEESTTIMTESMTVGETSTTEAPTTTTTSEAPAGPTFLANAGFEASPVTTDPWGFFITEPNYALSLDSDIKHDGEHSARIDLAVTATNYIRQEYSLTPEAGVPYSVSAWVRGGARQNGQRTLLSLAGSLNEWKQISGTCNYSQAQINAGNLYLYVGFTCSANGQGWIDTVSFGPSQ
ncbi:hypothetical protein ACHAPJ_010329 [Fusarium lateritium]